MVLDLPIGSKEGTYNVGLVTDTGDELLCARGRRRCVVTLAVCGSMSTSVPLDLEHILKELGSLVLSEPAVLCGVLISTPGRRMNFHEPSGCIEDGSSPKRNP